MRQVISLAVSLSLVCLVSAQTSVPPLRSPGMPGTPGGGIPPAKMVPAEKSGLEKAIEAALKHNPDLRVAAAKVNEAEASLSRSRLQVTQKVVTAYQAVEVGKATVGIAQVTLERLRKLQKANTVAADEVAKAEQELAVAKGKLATAEADLNYLLGQSAHRPALGSNSYWGSNVLSGNLGDYRPTTLGGTNLSVPLTPPNWNTGTYLNNSNSTPYFYYALTPNTINAKANTQPSGDKIRKALDHCVTLKFSETPNRDALKLILKEAPGLHVQASLREPAWDEKLSANLIDMPLGAVLQLLEDSLGDHAIVVRGYGLLIVSKNHVPPGAVLLNEFWQGGVKSEKAPMPKQKPK